MKITIFLFVMTIFGCGSPPPCVEKCIRSEQQVVRKLAYMGLTATAGVANIITTKEDVCVEYRTICKDMNINKK
jgi:hypothetical protein